MAWLGIIVIFFLHGYTRACKSSCLDPFNSYLLIPEERRKIYVLSRSYRRVNKLKYLNIVYLTLYWHKSRIRTHDHPHTHEWLVVLRDSWPLSHGLKLKFDPFRFIFSFNFFRKKISRRRKKKFFDAEIFFSFSTKTQKIPKKLISRRFHDPGTRIRSARSL